MTSDNTGVSEILERFRNITELVSDFAYSSRVAPDGSVFIEWITDSLTESIGYTLDDLNARGWQGIIYPDDLHLALKQIGELGNGKDSISEHRIIAKNGEVRLVRHYMRPVLDMQGRLIHLYCAAVDIAAQKPAKEE